MEKTDKLTNDISQIKIILLITLVCVCLVAGITFFSYQKKLEQMIASYEKISLQQHEMVNQLNKLIQTVDNLNLTVDSEEIASIVKQSLPPKKKIKTPSNELQHYELINRYYEENE